MVLLQSGFFDISKYITHPISLVAYVCALILYYFISKNVNDRKKLEANPEAYRATAERLDLKLNLIPEDKRADVTMRVLKNRIISQLIIAVTLIIGGLIVSYIFVDFTQGERKRDEDQRQQREIYRKDSLDGARRIDAQLRYVKMKNGSIKSIKRLNTNPTVVLTYQKLKIEIISIENVKNCSRGPGEFYYTFKVNDILIDEVKIDNYKVIEQGGVLSINKFKTINLLNKQGSHYELDFQIFERDKNDAHDHLEHIKSTYFNQDSWDDGTKIIPIVGGNDSCEVKLKYKISLLPSR